MLTGLLLCLHCMFFRTHSYKHKNLKTPLLKCHFSMTNHFEIICIFLNNFYTGLCIFVIGICRTDIWIPIDMDLASIRYLLESFS